MITTSEINDRLEDETKRVDNAQKLYLYNNGHIDEIGQDVIEDYSKTIKKVEHKSVNLSEMINDSFYPLFNGQITEPYRIFKGGRSSFKSSAISIKLVYDFLSDDRANIIGFRKVGSYLSTSIYEQIKWAIMMLGVFEEFKFLKSPLKIIHLRTNTAFYFYGVDDPLKIKSAKIAEGYVSHLWYEETAEFNGTVDLDTVNDTFVREELPEGKEVQVYYSYNPPRNPYSWINEWLDIMKADSNVYIHHSTYLDDVKGFLSKQFLERIATVKKNDNEYYRWMYLGEVIGLGDNVYNVNAFNRVHEFPTDDRLIFADIALDTGYANSATTFLFVGFTAKGRSILLDTYYYSPKHRVQKKAPSDFSDELWAFAQRNTEEWMTGIDTWTIDSADAGLRNQFMKDYGISLTPARKGRKVQMIESVRDHMALGNAYILEKEANRIFYDEHRKYQWNEDSLETSHPKIIDIDDHTCDAYQYYVINNKDKLKLSL